MRNHLFLLIVSALVCLSSLMLAYIARHITVSLIALTVCMLLMTIACLLRYKETRAAKWQRYLVTALSITQLVITIPLSRYVTDVRLDKHFFWIFNAVLVVCAVASILSLRASPQRLKYFLGALLLLYCCDGVQLIRAVPKPKIDVLYWQELSTERFLRGINPYLGPMPNFYPNDKYYPPNWTKNNRINTGFQYPPVVLLLDAPSVLITGDPRYSLMLANMGTAFFIAMSNPTWLGVSAAALFLFMPSNWYVLVNSWVDVYGLLFLSLALYLQRKKPTLAPFAWGLMIVTKQYFLAVLPLLWLLRNTPAMRNKSQFVIRMLISATAVTLPFIIMNPQRFYHSLIRFHAMSPFRKDSLNYTALLARMNGYVTPQSLGFVVLLLCLGLCLWRAPRNELGFALSLAFINCGFFAFGKQAFVNYYYFIAGILCCALAAFGNVNNYMSENVSRQAASASRETSKLSGCLAK